MTCSVIPAAPPSPQRCSSMLVAPGSRVKAFTVSASATAAVAGWHRGPASPHFAPLIRDAYARRWRRPARFAGDSGACRYLHDPAVHASRSDAVTRSLPCRPSTRLGSRPALASAPPHGVGCSPTRRPQVGHNSKIGSTSTRRFNLRISHQPVVVVHCPNTRCCVCPNGCSRPFDGAFGARGELWGRKWEKVLRKGGSPP